MSKRIETAVVFLTDSKEQALLVRYKGKKLDFWGFPKCILKPKEKPAHAAMRAIKHHSGLILDSRSVSIMLCDKSVYGHKIYFFVANVESLDKPYKNGSLHSEEELRVLDRLNPTHRTLLWAIKPKLPDHE